MTNNIDLSQASLEFFHVADMARDAGLITSLAHQSDSTEPETVGGVYQWEDVQKTHLEAADRGYDSLYISAGGGWDHTLSNRTKEDGTLDDNFYPHMLPFIIRWKRTTTASGPFQLGKLSSNTVGLAFTVGYVYAVLATSISSRVDVEFGPLGDGSIESVGSFPMITPVSKLTYWNMAQAVPLNKYQVGQVKKAI